MEHLLSSKSGEKPVQGGPTGKGIAKENSSPPPLGPGAGPTMNLYWILGFPPRKAEILPCRISFSIVAIP